MTISTTSATETEGIKARDAYAKQRAAEREADAKQREEFMKSAMWHRLAIVRLQGDWLFAMVIIIGTTLTSIAVGVAVLGLWLRQGG